MCFAKQFVLLFLMNYEKLLVVLVKCLKNSYISDIFKKFCLDFKLLSLLHFRFPFQFLFLPFQGGLELHNNLPDESPW